MRVRGKSRGKEKGERGRVEKGKRERGRERIRD
jgi:hypothetical protein